MPELSLIAKDVEIHLIHEGFDAEVTSKTWVFGAQFIFERRNDFSGFIVLASIDNIPYFAQALALMLKNIAFPIVFTGSQLPDYLLDDKSGLEALLEESEDVGIRANIVNAIQVVHQQFVGVFTLFGGVIINAERIYVKKPLSHMPFAYHPTAVLGKVEFSTKIVPEYTKVGKNFKSQGIMSLDDRIESKVKFFSITPLFSEFKMDEELEGIKGAIFYLPSTFSYSSNLLEELAKRGPRIPVVFCAQSFILPKGGSSIPLIKKLEGTGIIVVSGKGIPEVLVTFMCALGRTNDIQEIKKILLE
jgi:L-asparaginase